jgi:hypothetical protein
VTTLDDLLDAGDKRRDQTRHAGRVVAGYLRIAVWSAGWLLARTITLLLTIAAALFFMVGWTCACVVPVLKWARAAFTLGWEAGRPLGGGRGPA